MLLGWAHPRFGELFDLLNLFIRQHFQIADNVRTVPFILFLHRLEQKTWIPVPILIAAEQLATSLLSLWQKNSTLASNNEIFCCSKIDFCMQMLKI